MSGTVKEYEAGKKIKLSGPMTSRLPSTSPRPPRSRERSSVGQMATVKYTKGTDGKETVSVVSEATANAVTAAEAPKMH